MTNFGNTEGLSGWSQRICDMLDEMLNRRFVPFRDAGPWQPATDVYETRSAYLVCVDLAGMQPEAVQVNVHEQHRVVISGARPSPRPEGVEGPLSMHVMEIDQGAFRREVELPESVQVDRVEAKYDKGFLWILLPKSATE